MFSYAAVLVSFCSVENSVSCIFSLNHLTLRCLNQIKNYKKGAMPEDSHFYYGFTRFAIELNEFTEDLKSELPPTDTRFRPDQRCLENGQVEKAELEKHRIEEMQRMRRKDMEARGLHHQPLWFAMQDSEWSFNGQYWTKRENQGFKAMKSNFPNLW